MKYRLYYGALVAAIAAPCVIALADAQVAGAVKADARITTEPGGQAADVKMASQTPDEYAWHLFFFLNRQAKPGTAGEADTSKQTLVNYDPDKAVVWESWALASGADISDDTGSTNVSEVFKYPATQPVVWTSLNRSSQPKLLFPDFKRLALLPPASALKMAFHTAIAPDGSNPAEDETRMNRSTYDTVRDKHLYSVEGVQAAVAKAKAAGQTSIVQFEPDSKEVKARWIHLVECDAKPACADKARYHWRTVTNNGKQEIWGLAALHIITKDLPNWFWADFGHVDCEKPVGACAGPSPGAKTPLRDSTLPKGGPRPEVTKSKWAFYVLRGTQTEFVTTTGLQTILSNPIIEKPQQQSSCMTCHAYASAGDPSTNPESPASLPSFIGLTFVQNAGVSFSDLGEPKCGRLYDPTANPNIPCPGFFEGKTPSFLQTDFLWSIPFRAFSETKP